MFMLKNEPTLASRGLDTEENDVLCNSDTYTSYLTPSHSMRWECRGLSFRLKTSDIKNGIGAKSAVGLGF